MKRKYILLTNIFIIAILYGCGYKPVHSSKDFLFKIDQITHTNSTFCLFTKSSKHKTGNK